MGIEARPNAEASIRGNGLVLALLLGVGIRVTRLVVVTGWASSAAGAFAGELPPPLVEASAEPPTASAATAASAAPSLVKRDRISFLLGVDFVRRAEATVGSQCETAVSRSTLFLTLLSLHV